MARQTRSLTSGGSRQPATHTSSLIAGSPRRSLPLHRDPTAAMTRSSASRPVGFDEERLSPCSPPLGCDAETLSQNAFSEARSGLPCGPQLRVLEQGADKGGQKHVTCPDSVVRG